MASLEQIGSWKEQLRDGQPETLFAGTSYEFDVSPAEKIRYAENEKLGAAVCQEFVELSRRDSLTRADLDEMKIATQGRVSPEQQPLIERVHVKLVELMEHHPSKAEVIEQLPKACSLLFRSEEPEAPIPTRSGIDDIWARIEKIQQASAQHGAAEPAAEVPSFLDLERDVVISPFGAVLVYVRGDKASWAKRVKGVSEGNDIQLGFKLQRETADKKAHGVTHMAPSDTFPKELEGLIVLCDDGTDMAKDTATHEKTHDLYERVFESLQKPGYPSEAMNQLFRSIKDEIVAYLSIHHWEHRISSLGNLESSDAVLDTFSIVSSHLESDIYKERMPSEDFDEDLFKETNAQAKALTQEIRAVCGQFFRLKCGKSESQDLALKKLLAAQTFKEMAYQLTTIDQKPLRVLGEIKQDGLFLNLQECERVLRSVRSYGLRAEDLSQIKDGLEAELGAVASTPPHPSREKRTVYIKRLLKKYFSTP